MIVCWKCVSQSPEPFYFYKAGIRELTLHRKYLFIQLYFFLSSSKVCHFLQAYGIHYKNYQEIQNNYIFYLSIHANSYLLINSLEKYNMKWHRIKFISYQTQLVSLNCILYRSFIKHQ